MKKLLFVALVAAGMTACMQNEELAAPKGDAIAFENAYVGNSVRAAVDPSQTTNSINSFNVWGYLTSEAGTVFEGTEVTKNGNVWGYEGTQYWLPGNEYYFSALSPIDGNWNKDAVEASVAGLSNVQFTNDGTVDLLYAHEDVSTVGKGLNDTYAPVALEFQHLLSKVKFTFLNGFGTDNTTVEIKNLTMTAPKSATINLTAATKEWALGTESVALAFGNVERLSKDNNNTAECATECLTIPAGDDYVYNVTFDVEVYVGTLTEPSYTTTKEATISGYALEMGNAYNFTAEITPANLGLAPIEFTATVQEWNTVANAAVGKYVYDLAGLQAAVDAAVDGDVICLGNDIAGELTIVQKKNVKLTLNGNGHKYVGQIKIHGNSNYQAGCATVIKNVAFETETADNCSVYAVDFGSAQRYSQNITVEGCTFTATGAAAQTAVGVKVNASKNLVVKGCTATNMHSLLQAQSCDDAILVDGCTTVGCKNGVSFGNTAYPTLRNSEIAAAEYGVRADGTASRGALVVANTTIDAKQGIVVRKVTTAGYSVNLGAGVEITTDENYQVVFTSGSDDVAYVKPTVDFSYTSVNEEFKVFPLSPMLTDIMNPNNTEEVLPGVGEDSEGAVVVTEPVGLASLSLLVAAHDNGFAGKTVKLNADIDLALVARTLPETTKIGDSDAPIGSTGERDGRGRLICNAFKGTFDGNGKAIKNLYQSGWDMGYEWGQYGSIGLFASLEDATVKNLVIEGMEAQVEGGDISFIAGSAEGTCVFENITIRDSRIGTYNNGCGGIIGWSGAGNYTFKDIVLESDVVLGGLWGSFDSSIGGVVGQAEPGATYNFENVTINCRIDAYNDCTASYDYYQYRMCGMVVGRCQETTTIDGRNYPDLSKYNMTFTNVVVNYGTWMNYHYCEPTPGHNNGRGMRIEPGFAYGGLPEDFDHTQCVDNHYNCIPFDQLIGGDQYGVRGLREVEGITVNYPAAYTCPLCGNTHNNE